MLFSKYSTLFTTAFVEFNQRLINARSNFMDYEILTDEEIFKDFVIDIFALRKIYGKIYEEDMHAEILQPKVEIIYDLLQNNIEDVRKGSQLVGRLIEEMFYYCKSITETIESPLN